MNGLVVQVVTRSANPVRLIPFKVGYRNRMRILILTQAYRPFIGGSEQFARDLATELVSRGHEVALVTLANSLAPDFEVDEGVRVYRLRGSVHRAASFIFKDPKRGHAPPFPDPEITWGLKQVVARERPQIVHAIDWLVHSYLPISILSRAKLVMTLQDYSLLCAKKTLMYHDAPCPGPNVIRCVRCGSHHYGPIKGPVTVLLNRFMGGAERSNVDMFVPISQAVASNSGLLGSRLPWKVIPNFVVGSADAAADGAMPCLAQLPSEGYILFVGALSSKKGVDVLLRAYAGCAPAVPLVLVGYSTVEYPVCLDNLPPNVILLKDVPHEGVMYAWRRSLIGVVPSVWPEPFGIVALEAMLAGRPVIASRTGGLQDIVVHGESGFLVPPGDSDALKDAIALLLSDSELRRGMGEAARKRVERFLASTVVPEYERLYEDLLD